MSEFQSSNFKKENGGTPDLLGKTELTSPYFFVPPSGTTAERPESCAAGTIRFNTDIGTLEVFRGDTVGWESIQRRESQYLGGGTGSNTGTGTRMIFMGGTDGSSTLDVIEFITISTLGNVQDFGNLISSEMEGASCSSRTRGFYFGGDPADNDIEFITFASLGNATDFGNCTATSKSGSGCSDQTRGILQLGASWTDTINYITMASTGDAADFGNLTGGAYAGGASSSSTRGIIALGSVSGNYVNTIDFVTIASTGNGVDFGDLTRSGVHCVAYSNPTRGVFHAGYQYPASPNFMNIIDYVTIATQGNAIDFGDSLTGGYGAGGASRTRGIAGGGYFANAPTGGSGGFTNIIDFVEIATTGNAQDFGDLSAAKRHLKGDSNGHGGL